MGNRYTWYLIKEILFLIFNKNRNIWTPTIVFIFKTYISLSLSVYLSTVIIYYSAQSQQ